jgi:aspartyl-tRNA(Asn)/glutamyl-tRNA(Gln) amidotransferase subunit B
MRICRSKKLSTNCWALTNSARTLPEDIESFATEHGFIQVSDEGEIAKIVEQVLAENPKAAEDVRNGEMKAIGFLTGQVMKASKGKANPSLAQTLIKKQLGL